MRTDAQKLHIQGMFLRIDQEYTLAAGVLKSAESLATNVTDKALIRREIGKTYLDEAVLLREGDPVRLGAAERYFRQSHSDLIKAGNAVETAVSFGYWGLALFLQGDKRKGVNMLIEAHDSLSGFNDTYELDILFTVARISVIQRYIYAHRVWVLCKRTDEAKQWKQYLAILAGRDRLYRF